MKIGNPEEQVRLRELAGKIRALLKEYDVAGIVNIQGKDQAEFVNEITPSWSCLSWDFTGAPEERPAIRFKAAMKTGGNEEKEKARLTAGMVIGFEHVMGMQLLQLGQLIQLLGKHMDITNVMEQQLTAPPGLQPPPKDNDTYKFKAGDLVWLNGGPEIWRVMRTHGQRNDGTGGYENEYALELIHTTVAGESQLKPHQS